jgi:uncharacterized protein YfaS (alpha-2-macroglobulin family)
VAGASATITIVKSNGTVVSFSLTTGTDGTAMGKYRIKRQDPLGTYQASAAVSATNAASAQGSTAFTVQ